MVIYSVGGALIIAICPLHFQPAQLYVNTDLQSGQHSALCVFMRHSEVGVEDTEVCLVMSWGGRSTGSSGYCSQDDSDSELEHFFTAHTSFLCKPKTREVRSFIPLHLHINTDSRYADVCPDKAVCRNIRL